MNNIDFISSLDVLRGAALSLTGLDSKRTLAINVILTALKGIVSSPETDSKHWDVIGKQAAENAAKPSIEAISFHD